MTRRLLVCGVLVSMVMVLLAVACGSPAPSSSRPPGRASTSAPAPRGAATPATHPAAVPAPRRHRAGPLAVPPFGTNARVVMTSWLPRSAAEARAVISAKDFLLAVLYSDYTGGRDHRWQKYVGSGLVLRGMTETLKAPAVTTQSWIGTIRIWRMFAVPGTFGPNTISVTECIDSSRALNTRLRTGQVLPPREQSTTEQNYYSNTDVLEKNAAGQWGVISIPPVINYPEAIGCGPGRP